MRAYVLTAIVAVGLLSGPTAEITAIAQPYQTNAPFDAGAPDALAELERAVDRLIDENCRNSPNDCRQPRGME